MQLSFAFEPVVANRLTFTLSLSFFLQKGREKNLPKSSCEPTICFSLKGAMSTVYSDLSPFFDSKWFQLIVQL